MWIFGKRSKLLRQLDRLAFYNDKGIAYARHNPAQVKAEQALGLAKIKDLVAAIGPSSFPDSFLAAVDSGAITTDLTGQYIDILKAHFRGRGAP